MMTDKLFLHLASQKAALKAGEFLSTHREFLLSGSRRELTEPLFAALDRRETYPTPTLQKVLVAITAHMGNVEAAKGAIKREKAEVKASQPIVERQTSKAYTATVYDGEGHVAVVIKDGEEVPLTKDFNCGEKAQEWCDRRLFEGASDWHGKLVSHRVVVAGNPWVVRIERADSIARILKAKRMATHRVKKQSTPRLSFGMSCHQDTCSFSRG